MKLFSKAWQERQAFLFSASIIYSDKGFHRIYSCLCTFQQLELTSSLPFSFEFPFLLTTKSCFPGRCRLMPMDYLDLKLWRQMDMFYISEGY